MSEATPLPAPPPARPASGQGAPRLRAVTRRVPRRPAAAAGDGDAGDDEPGADGVPPGANRQLFRALGVMLLLHVVALGGVVTFGMIKDAPAVNGNKEATRDGKNPAAAAPTARGGAAPRAAATSRFAAAPDNAPTPYPAGPNTPPRPADPAAAAGAAVVTPGRVISAGPPLSRVEADAVRLIESAGPNPLLPGERAYVVGRGETVQTIAQKLRVDPAALLRLNQIDDPRKIQPGQRLRVPPSPPGRSRS